MTVTVTSNPGQTWELGELDEIDPQLVIRDENDKLGRLVLRLALAFNDLKGIIMLDRYRLQFLPAEGVGPHLGQAAGLAVQVHRYAAGMINEALNAIDDERTATADQEFAAIIATLDTDTQSMWRGLLAEARNSPDNTNNTTRAMLNRLRNSSAFHYNGNRLRRAYWDYFDATRTDYNRAAFYSAGADMDGTRFYFADAAAEHDYKTAGTERGIVTQDQLYDLIGKINNAFALFIIAFLRTRKADGAEKAAPAGTSPS